MSLRLVKLIIDSCIIIKIKKKIKLNFFIGIIDVYRLENIFIGKQNDIGKQWKQRPRLWNAGSSSLGS